MNALVEQERSDTVSDLTLVEGVGKVIFLDFIAPKDIFERGSDSESEDAPLSKFTLFRNSLSDALNGGLRVPQTLFTRRPSEEPFTVLTEMAEGVGGVLRLTGEKPDYETMLDGISDVIVDLSIAGEEFGFRQHTVEQCMEHFGIQLMAHIDSSSGIQYMRQEDRSRLKKIYQEKLKERRMSLWEKFGLQQEE